MVYKDILFELYEAGGRKRLRVLYGQSIPVKHIRSSHADRDAFSEGNIFVADLCDHSSDKYYTFAYAGTTLAECFFAPNIHDERVKHKLSATMTKEAEPVVSSAPSVFTAPAIPGDLQVNRELWRFLNATIKLGKYPLLLGPKGCGKSEVARRLAEANGMDFFEFDCGQAHKPKKQFIGGLINGDEGKTEIVRSQFFKAFISDKPTLIFLDELTRIPTVAANFMMTILSRNQSYIYSEDEGVRYEKGKDVVFIAAGNVGYSYVSTNRLDSAFEDRFVKCMVDYMPESSEIKLITSRVTGVGYSDAQVIVRAANLLRAAERKGTLSVSLSTRQVLDAAAYIPMGFTAKDVLTKVILTNYIISEEYEAAQGILQSM
jgi:nitric oxide reductase NorQ protein